MKKKCILSFVLAFMMALSVLVPVKDTNAATTQEFTRTATEIVKDMGNGWNLGNTMECAGSWINSSSVDNYETAWGNPKTTQALLDAVKSAGFDSVRIPIAWSNMMSKDGKYTISSEYFRRVDEIIEYAYKNDMYVIINIHWDGGWWDDFISDSTKDEAMKKYKAMWSQISSHYKNYSEKLIFESANEELNNKLGYKKCNMINQEFVNVVRKSGGNNAKRYLLIAGYGTDIYGTCSSNFEMPEDTIKNHLMISVHYYSPATYCIATKTDNDWGYRDDWGSTSDIAQMRKDFEKMKKFSDEGYGVIIGEYGVLLKENADKTNSVKNGTATFLKNVVALSRELGYSAFLWDKGDWMDRNACCMKYSDIKMVYMKNISGVCNNGVTWEIDFSAGVMNVRGNGSVPDYASVDKTEWYAYKDYIKYLSIGNGITAIGKNAFRECGNLLKVSGMNNVKRINAGAFMNDAKLSSVSGCTLVESIGMDSFSGCAKLTQFGNNAGCIRIFAKEVGDSAFKGCKSMTFLSISDNLKTIGNHSFNGCSLLATVSGMKNVSKIGKYAFAHCSKLKTMGDKAGFVQLLAKDTGAYVFYDCPSIVNVTIGKNVTRICEGTFRDCLALKYVYGMENVTYIGAHAFRENKNLQKVSGLEKLATVGTAAFYNCVKLVQIGKVDNSFYLPGIETIGDSTFSNCYSVKQILTGTKLTQIGAYALKNTKALNTFKISSAKLTKVGVNAFMGIKSGCNILVPSAQLNTYKNSVLKGKGQPSTVVIKAWK